MLAIGLLVLLGTAPAWAQPAPGAPVVLDHAVAVALDNAEGLLEPGVRMRLLLADRAVSGDALLGIAFPPARGMARRGEVRGLLVEFDPKDRTKAQLTILERKSEPGAFLTTLTLSDSEGLFSKLSVDDKHISGRLVSKSDDLDVGFDGAGGA
jgi:hypothetical protein